ncbi:MAG: stage IV sporulation protein A [Lachnospiraceae bacterium]|nr:stage IV sporulation protein A [Lachnospiraceae bacterium]
MEEFQVYTDIASRTNGEIYLGVCGPVRTGKSTFIKRFMEQLVIPSITNEHDRQRAVDELPQSADGKTIMTTEPKFIPKEAVGVRLLGDNEVKVRLIDCVGYIVDGANGLTEDGEERMVMTPWSKEPMPFTRAAEFGTRKVIHEHSTVGVVVTTDGSFGELERSAYLEAEERTIRELKEIGKAFVVLVNSIHPYSEETRNIVQEISEQYNVEAMAVNAGQLRSEDIQAILERLLHSFPVTQIEFNLPKWVEMLPNTHWLKAELLEKVREILDKISKISDVTGEHFQTESDMIKEFHIRKIGMENGKVEIDALFDDTRYYQILSELVGTEISGEYQLIRLLKEYTAQKEEISKMGQAWQEVHQKGYGVITPSTDEITIEEPQLIHHGNKYGVKLKAVSPSVHMIRANIETEIAPIVGTQEQAEDLLEYIAQQGGPDKEGIWDTNIFGKTVRQLVEEGMSGKVSKLTQESQLKLQETIQKVINDSNGGLVCIII